jgi:hypothetical protein
MLAHSSVSNQLEEKAATGPISAARTAGTPAATPSPAKFEAASTAEGGRFHSFEFSAEERQELHTLLFAFLTDAEVGQQGTTTFNPKDGSPISVRTSDEFDSSDGTATTDSDLSDDDFSDDDFTDDDAE